MTSQFLSWHHLVIEATGFKRVKERGVLFTKGEQRSFVTTPYEGRIEYQHDVETDDVAISDARYVYRLDDGFRFTPVVDCLTMCLFGPALC